MKNFIDKIIYFALFFILILTSCKNGCRQNEDLFLTKIGLFSEIINEIKVNNSKKEWNKKDLEKNINSKTLEILNKLDFNNIERFKDVYVLSFKTKYQAGFLDNLSNKNMTSCNVYLFYSKNLKNRENIINYPQYSECRYKRKELTSNWTYTFQKWYCAD